LINSNDNLPSANSTNHFRGNQYFQAGGNPSDIKLGFWSYSGINLPTQLSVGFNCDDYLALQVVYQGGQIARFGNNYLDQARLTLYPGTSLPALEIFRRNSSTAWSMTITADDYEPHFNSNGAAYYFDVSGVNKATITAAGAINATGAVISTIPIDSVGLTRGTVYLKVSDGTIHWKF
jgi:hypothetical protein